MSQSQKDNDQKATSSGNNQPTPNPFRSGSSRYGRSSSSGSSSSGNTPPRPPAPRFGGLGSRFGSSTIEFEIRPVEDTFVRFDLGGLGDPFHRILGTELNLAHGDPQNVVKTIQNGGEAVDALIAQLEDAWKSYEINGALVVYDWQDEIKQAIGTKATGNTQTSDDEDYYDDDDDDDNNKAEPTKETRKAPVCLRAIDHVLVINVLARTRSGILLAEAPLSLESGFLERSLITDDPRLVTLARATGCLEEQIVV